MVSVDVVVGVWLRLRLRLLWAVWLRLMLWTVDVVVGCVVEVDVVDSLCQEVWARLGSGVGLKDSRGSGRCVGWWHQVVPGFNTTHCAQAYNALLVVLHSAGRDYLSTIHQ